MHINPGGVIDPDELVGRTQEIEKYWRILERQGLILSAERRIGKTSIVKKMHHCGRHGFITFYQELEKIHSVLELVRSMYDTVSQTVSLGAKIKGKFVNVWAALAPARIKDIDLPQAKDKWKSLLTIAISDVINGLEPDQKALFIWDEFPLMLYNIVRHNGGDSAIELLDQLRYLRQSHGNQLRFLFTGSIGLHLVLRSLRAAGNANSPVNDMYPDTVPPMASAESLELATKLLAGMTMQPKEPQKVAVRTIERVQGFPFYIHQVVDQLDQLGRVVGPDDVDRAVEDLIYLDRDPADFGYYVHRIQRYYDHSERGLALAILDTLAQSSNTLTFQAVLNNVRHTHVSVTSEQVRDVLQLLREDHYLTRHKSDNQTSYAFRWILVSEWWKENRK